MLPRVGHIQFLNCLPLYYGLVKNGVLPELELFKNTPTELSRMLLSGALDISPVPAIEYARHANEILLFPRLTVSSDGKVLSILLVSKVPARELDGKPVALASTSATSQVLAKIILKEKYQVQPYYFESPPDLPQMFMEADAALLIGDDALRVLAQPKNYFIYDLGEEWKDVTGEKMVYAVWAVRKDYAEQHPDMVKKIYHAVERSMQLCQEKLADIARDVAQGEPFSSEFLYRYFCGLKFEFGEDYQRGYLKFLKMAQELGAIDAIPQLRFVEIS